MEFAIDTVVEINGAGPLRGELLNYSRFTPVA